MINHEIAEILGAFIGDGWIESRQSALYIMGSPTEDKDYYDNFLAPLFSKHFTSIKPKAFPCWKVYGIAIYKKDIIDKAIDLGFQIGPKSLVAEIPDKVMRSSDKITKAVLRGLFDTDGSFFCKKAYGKYDKDWTKTHHCKPRIQLGIASERLSKQVAFLLEKLHIDCNVGFFNCFYNKFFSFIYNCHKNRNI